MKKTLLMAICAVAALSMTAQVAPVSGTQYHVRNGSGLYLTYDPEWNEADEQGVFWNRVLLDSLYTTTKSVILEFEIRDAIQTVAYNTRPEKQIFTVEAVGSYWALKTYEGNYISIHESNGWDVNTNASSSATGSQISFVPQSEGIYAIQFSGHTDYLAADKTNAGVYVDQYDDGWQYVAHNPLYRNKPIDQAGSTALWTLMAVPSAVENVYAVQQLNVYVNDNNELKGIENGTSISIYSISGSKVIDTVSNGSLSVANLAAGIYIVSTPEGKAKFVKK